MLAILLIIVFVGLFIYYAISNAESIGSIIVGSLCIIFVVVLCFGVVSCFFTTYDEYIIEYDSYCITYDLSRFSGGTIDYISDDNILSFHANTINKFNGETQGYFILRDIRFDQPDWFWFIAFIPDGFLIRTEVLIV